MRERTTKKLAKFAIAYIGALLLVGTPATSSAAEEPTNTQEESSLSASDSPTDTKEERWPWRFIVNVYGWLPKAPVDIKIDGNDIENFPESFDNIFDSLQFASMSEVEVHKGDVWLIKYGASYDLGPWHLGETSDSPAVVLQPYVGGLYFHDDIEMKVSPGLFDIGLDYKTTLTFNTPIVGLNTLWDLTKRWTLRLGGNYGGFHQDNVKKTYEFVGTVGYRFKMWDVSSKVFAGYRYLHLDYDREVELQVDIKGPLFGIGWEF